MELNYVHGGRAYGSMAQAMMANNFDTGVYRPFLHADGRTYVTVMERGQPVTKMLANVNSTMRYEDWRTWDDILIEAAKSRLGFVQDVLSRGLTRNVNAMNTVVLSHERVSDVTGAKMSMDGLSKSEKDKVDFDVVNTPLPFIHKDFGFPMRELSIARANGTPLDTMTGQRVARRVAEYVEDVSLGNISPYAFQGLGSVYGLRTFPGRATKVLTLPTAPGWTPDVTVNEVIDMKNTARLNLHYGPFVLYISSNWEPYLDQDYSAAYSGETLRSRLRKIENVEVKSLDRLSGYQMILVEMSIETLRMIVGMPLRLIQWMSPDDMEINFRYIVCMVPEFFSDIAGNCGVVHGTAV